MLDTIIFTGGGSGGHVVPAITLINSLKNEKILIQYIGGKEGIERNLIEEVGIRYFPISTGKLRRYISLQNFLDIFKILLGFFQSIYIILRFKRKTTIVFSTGGFVAVPVVFAAKLLGLKIFIHEQTSRVGLANKLSSFVADRVFVSFEESLNFFPKEKTIKSGYPIRSECFTEDIGELVVNNIDLKQVGKDILFVTGGGNGSVLINELILKNIEFLKENFLIIHQVGKKYIAEYKQYQSADYHPLEFIGSEMIDLMKVATIVISRSGAGTVCELMAIGKKSLFIPLKIAQKNEQFHNAKAAEKLLGSFIISEDDLDKVSLKETIEQLKATPENGKRSTLNGNKIIVDAILSLRDK